MSSVRIRGGRIHDPVNGVDGAVRDIVVRVTPGVDPGYVAALAGALRQC